MTGRRLDVEVADRGLARSRSHARGLIVDGCVEVDGFAITRPAELVDAAVSIVVPDSPIVSRGATKLAGALDALDVPVAGRRALDVGAGTGGFTSILLERGAKHVIALDVGSGQLAASLRQDPRVTVLEKLNARTMSRADLPYLPELVACDVSFISLTQIIVAIVAVAAPNADYLMLVKPQFEQGAPGRTRRGIVERPVQRAAAIRAVAEQAGRDGLGVRGIAQSGPPGTHGNIEYFLWLHAGAGQLSAQAIDDACSEVSR